MTIPANSIATLDVNRKLDFRSNRLKMWDKFSKTVRDHIEHYTVPQYGDWPDDELSSWSAEECLFAIRSYVARVGSNARGAQETVRDCMKIAHYASVAWTKLTDNENDSEDKNNA